jgi:nucleoside-diphosphate-sugar epimerase
MNLDKALAYHMPDHRTIGPKELVLVTGATGFIGTRLVERLLQMGFVHLRCLARPSSDTSQMEILSRRYPEANLEIIVGNLLSKEDCAKATRGVSVVFNLAAGTGQKSFPDAFMNSVVTTRNILEAIGSQSALRRFVTVSSFAVYSNAKGAVLDESSPIEHRPELRGEAYCFAKVKQEQVAAELCNKTGIPHVIVRPGYVYGPGKEGISDRIGIDTFGVFIHLGGANSIPLTYVDNCAEAIALAGLCEGVEGEIFNVVDDDLPTSRQFLRMYKDNVRRFRSLYVPHAISYALCAFWERYVKWSSGQLPLAFNRHRWNAYWRKTKYSNQKLKAQLGWIPRVSTEEGLRRYFSASLESK